MNDADHAADRFLAALAEVERVAPGLSLGQLTMLLHVVRREGVRISDLARLGGWTESRVSRGVRAMTEAGEPGALAPAYGLIEILRGGDARARHLVPTTTGAALAKSLMLSAYDAGMELTCEATSLEAARRAVPSEGGDQQSECQSF